MLIAIVANSAARVGVSGKSIAQPVDFVTGSDIGAKAGANFHGGGLSVPLVSGAALLPCAFQKFEGMAGEDGLWLVPTAGSTTGDRLRVIAWAWGRSEASFEALVRTCTVELEPGLAQFVWPGVIEDYSVSVDGVRKDFVITRRPAGEGKLRVELQVTGAQAELAGGGGRVLKLEFLDCHPSLERTAPNAKPSMNFHCLIGFAGPTSAVERTTNHTRS